MTKMIMIAAIGLVALAGTASAQAVATSNPQAGSQGGSVSADAAAAKPKAPDALVVYFNSGSAAIRPQDVAVLDQASRLYRDGKPIVMVVSGSSDAVGSAGQNLTLSQARADAVLHGLVARGIPAERFQVLAKGETDLPVPTAQGVAEARNRRVEITWR